MQEELVGPAGHCPNINDLLAVIYELLAFFLASKPIADLERSSLYGTNDPIHQFEELQRDRITARLISIAITVRILDDRHSAAFDMVTDYCGTIEQHSKGVTETVGLSLRQACNKVIHATRVEFDLELSDQGVPYLHPYVYLEGAERNVPWHASLDIVKFCRESTAAVQLLP